MLNRVGPVLAGLAVVGALAIAVPTATGHPEECSEAAAWSNGTGYSPYASWEGAEKSVCVSESVQQRYDDSKALLATEGAEGTKNLKLLSSNPKPTPFESEGALNSDLAFEDGYAYQGNYNGVSIWNVKEPENPVLVNVIECLGSQNDVTVNDGILITSTDSRRVSSACDAPATTTGGTANPDPPTVWEGLRVWDVNDKQNPKLLTTVRTDCGSHTHTVIPQADRLLVYVSSYDVGAGRYECSNAAGNLSHDKISVVEVPKSAPATAKVINEPVLFPDGGNPGENAPGSTRRQTAGCHDITVYPEKGIAAGACTGEGVIMDITDPVNPKVIASREDENFAFWHSATISNDGKKVLFTDELGGGSGAECNPTIGPKRGADAIYDITDPANPKFMSYFKIPRTQTNEENCVAHNGNLIPSANGRDLLVQSWYQGGVSVIDWTDGHNVKEIAWFDRGPFNETRRVLAGFWSSYYYNGFIYGSEIQRGFDVFKLTGPEGAGAQRNKSKTLNAQTQYTYR
jgi:hypothetical protein